MMIPMSEQPADRPAHIGEARLGALAKRQIDAARNDPRLSCGQEAIVANYWDAVEEAERHRRLSVWGVHELADSLEGEEVRLGVRHDAPDLTESQAASLQAAWERAELARAEIENEHPFANAVTLVALQSALDALVEELVPSWATVLRLEWAIDSLEGEPKVLWDSLPEEVRHRLRFSFVEALIDLVRISRADYREYSAAVNAYGAEIVRRLMRDLVDDVDLAAWRGHVELNV
jgi:hypothetical protein